MSWFGTLVNKHSLSATALVTSLIVTGLLPAAPAIATNGQPSPSDEASSAVESAQSGETTSPDLGVAIDTLNKSVLPAVTGAVAGTDEGSQSDSSKEAADESESQAQSWCPSVPWGANPLGFTGQGEYAGNQVEIYAAGDAQFDTDPGDVAVFVKGDLTVGDDETYLDSVDPSDAPYATFDSELGALNDALEALQKQPSGKVSLDGATFTLTGDGQSPVQVFNISAEQAPALANADTVLNLTAIPGEVGDLQSTVILNVEGSDATTVHQNLQLDINGRGVTAGEDQDKWTNLTQHLMWRFPQADAVVIGDQTDMDDETDYNFAGTIFAAKEGTDLTVNTPTNGRLLSNGDLDVTAAIPETGLAASPLILPDVSACDAEELASAEAPASAEAGASAEVGRATTLRVQKKIGPIGRQYEEDHGLLDAGYKPEIDSQDMRYFEDHDYQFLLGCVKYGQNTVAKGYPWVRGNGNWVTVDFPSDCALDLTEFSSFMPDNMRCKYSAGGRYDRSPEQVIPAGQSADVTLKNRFGKKPTQRYTINKVVRVTGEGASLSDFNGYTFDIQTQANGQYAGCADFPKSASPRLAHGGSWTSEELPIGSTVTVSENGTPSAPPGYEFVGKTIDFPSFTIESGVNRTVTITNTFRKVASEPESTITVNKYWDNGSGPIQYPVGFWGIDGFQHNNNPMGGCTRPSTGAATDPAGPNTTNDCTIWYRENVSDQTWKLNWDNSSDKKAVFAPFESMWNKMPTNRWDTMGFRKILCHGTADGLNQFPYWNPTLQQNGQYNSMKNAPVFEGTNRPASSPHITITPGKLADCQIYNDKLGKVKLQKIVKDTNGNVLSKANGERFNVDVKVHDWETGNQIGDWTSTLTAGNGFAAESKAYPGGSKVTFSEPNPPEIDGYNFVRTEYSADGQSGETLIIPRSTDFVNGDFTRLDVTVTNIYEPKPAEPARIIMRKQLDTIKYDDMTGTPELRNVKWNLGVHTVSGFGSGKATISPDGQSIEHNYGIYQYTHTAHANPLIDGRYAQWDIGFAATDQSAQVRVAEEFHPDFDFDSLTCKYRDTGKTILEQKKNSFNNTPPGPFPQKMSDLITVEPGDDIECIFVNKPKTDSFQVQKIVDGDTSCAAGLTFKFEASIILPQVVDGWLLNREFTFNFWVQPGQTWQSAVESKIGKLPYGTIVTITELGIDGGSLAEGCNWLKNETGYNKTTYVLGENNQLASNREGLNPKFEVTNKFSKDQPDTATIHLEKTVQGKYRANWWLGAAPGDQFPPNKLTQPSDSDNALGTNGSEGNNSGNKRPDYKVEFGSGGANGATVKIWEDPNGDTNVVFDELVCTAGSEEVLRYTGKTPDENSPVSLTVKPDQHINCTFNNVPKQADRVIVRKSWEVTGDMPALNGTYTNSQANSKGFSADLMLWGKGKTPTKASWDTFYYLKQLNGGDPFYLDSTLYIEETNINLPAGCKLENLVMEYAPTYNGYFGAFWPGAKTWDSFLEGDNEFIAKNVVECNSKCPYSGFTVTATPTDGTVLANGTSSYTVTATVGGADGNAQVKLTPTDSRLKVDGGTNAVTKSVNSSGVVTWTITSTTSGVDLGYKVEVVGGKDGYEKCSYSSSRTAKFQAVPAETGSATIQVVKYTCDEGKCTTSQGALADWQVGYKEATNVTPAASNGTKPTGTNGNGASWNVTLTDKSKTSNFKVYETAQTGYTFDHMVCSVGSGASTEYTSLSSAVPLESGKTTKCTLFNKKTTAPPPTEAKIMMYKYICSDPNNCDRNTNSKKNDNWYLGYNKVGSSDMTVTGAVPQKSNGSTWTVKFSNGTQEGTINLWERRTQNAPSTPDTDYRHVKTMCRYIKGLSTNDPWEGDWFPVDFSGTGMPTNTNPTGSVTVKAGKILYCDFFNTEETAAPVEPITGSITIEKTLIDEQKSTTAAAGWKVNAQNAVSPSDLTVVNGGTQGTTTDSSGSGQAKWATSGLPGKHGTVNLWEVGPTWAANSDAVFESLVCKVNGTVRSLESGSGTGANANSKAKIKVNAGEDVVCTFTNRLKSTGPTLADPTSIIVYKEDHTTSSKTKINWNVGMSIASGTGSVGVNSDSSTNTSGTTGSKWTLKDVPENTSVVLNMWEEDKTATWNFKDLDCSGDVKVQLPTPAGTTPTQSNPAKVTVQAGVKEVKCYFHNTQKPTQPDEINITLSKEWVITGNSKTYTAGTHPHSDAVGQMLGGKGKVAFGDNDESAVGTWQDVQWGKTVTGIKGSKVSVGETLDPLPAGCEWDPQSGGTSTYIGSMAGDNGLWVDPSKSSGYVTYKKVSGNRQYKAINYIKCTDQTATRTGWIEVHKQVPNGSGGWKDVADYEVGMGQVAPIGTTTVKPKDGGWVDITATHGDGTYKQYDIYSPAGGTDKAKVKLWEVGPTTSANTGLVFKQLDCTNKSGQAVFPTYTSTNGLDAAHPKEFEVSPNDNIKCYIKNEAPTTTSTAQIEVQKYTCDYDGSNCGMNNENASNATPKGTAATWDVTLTPGTGTSITSGSATQPTIPSFKAQWGLQWSGTGKGSVKISETVKGDYAFHSMYCYDLDGGSKSNLQKVTSGLSITTLDVPKDKTLRCYLFNKSTIKPQTPTAKITFEKYAKPWGGSYALENGWQLGVSSQTTGVTVKESGAQPTKLINGKNGQTVWNVEYPASEKSAAFYLYEDDVPAGWSLASASCKQGTTSLTMQKSTPGYRVVNIDLSKGDVTCEFKNEQANPGSGDTAEVNIYKTVNRKEWQSGWSVKADSVDKNATLAKKSQGTDDSGGFLKTEAYANWTVTFNSGQSSTKLRLTEKQQDGYQFAKGDCTIYRASGNLDFTIPAKTFESTTGTDWFEVPYPVQKGDDLTCIFYNEDAPKQYDVKVTKKWKVEGGNELTNYANKNATVAVTGGAFKNLNESFKVEEGTTVTVEETGYTVPDGYEFVSLTIDGEPKNLNVTYSTKVTGNKTIEVVNTVKPRDTGVPDVDSNIWVWKKRLVPATGKEENLRWTVGLEQLDPKNGVAITANLGGMTGDNGGDYKNYKVKGPKGADASVKIWEVGPNNNTPPQYNDYVFDSLRCEYSAEVPQGAQKVFFTSQGKSPDAEGKFGPITVKAGYKVDCYIVNKPDETLEPAEVMLKKTITSKPGGEGTTRFAYNWWVKMDSADQSIATVKADNRPKPGGTEQPGALDSDGFQKTYTVNKCANSADGKRGTCWTVDFQQDGMATFNFSEKMRTDSINDTGDPVELAYVRGECKIARDGKTVTESFNVGNAAHPGKVGLQLQPGDKADCQLINSPTPYTAEVFVEKGYQDADGKWHTADSDLLEDWCVKVSTDVQGVTARPNGATGQGNCKVDGKDLGFQATAKGTFNAQTGANRTGASWTVELPSENSEVKLGISELQKPGWTYTQGNGLCWIKHEDGSSNYWWIDAKQGNAEYPSAMTITDGSDIGIKAGDKVRCRIMNIEPKATKITLAKTATVDGKTTYPKWEVGLSVPEADNGAWTVAPAGAQTVNPSSSAKAFEWNLKLPVGSDAVPSKKEVTVELWEQNPVGADPLKFESLTCTGMVAGSLKLPADDAMPTSANPATVKVKAGGSLSCTFKNKKEDPPAGANLTLEKKVVNPNGLLTSQYTEPGDWLLQMYKQESMKPPEELHSEKPTQVGPACDTKFGTCSSAKTPAWDAEPEADYQLYEGASGHPSNGLYHRGDWKCADGDIALLGGSLHFPSGEKYKDLTCTITNSTAEVTLLKMVDGGDSEPADFKLKAKGTGVDKTITGSAAASVGGSFLVKPGDLYTLSEEQREGYELDRVELYQVGPNCPALKAGETPKDSANCWKTVTENFNADKAELSKVKLEGGEWRVYRFVNKHTFVPTGPTLPHAGGMSTTIFLVVAGISLTGAVIFGPFSKRRQGRHAQ